MLAPPAAVPQFPHHAHPPSGPLLGDSGVGGTGGFALLPKSALATPVGRGQGSSPSVWMPQIPPGPFRVVARQEKDKLPRSQTASGCCLLLPTPSNATTQISVKSGSVPGFCMRGAPGKLCLNQNNSKSSWSLWPLHCGVGNLPQSLGHAVPIQGDPLGCRLEGSGQDKAPKSLFPAQRSPRRAPWTSGISHSGKSFLASARKWM